MTDDANYDLVEDITSEFTPDQIEACIKYNRMLTRTKPMNLKHLIWIRDEFEKRRSEREALLKYVTDNRVPQVIRESFARMWWVLQHRVNRLNRTISAHKLIHQLYGDLESND